MSRRTILPFADAEIEARAQLQEKLRELKAACGCREGFLGLLAGIAFFTMHYVVLHGQAFTWYQKIVAGVVIGLLSATVGKLLGLAWAHYRYRTLSRRLERCDPVRCGNSI
jgi:hypothetical protein